MVLGRGLRFLSFSVEVPLLTEVRRETAGELCTPESDFMGGSASVGGSVGLSPLSRREGVRLCWRSSEPSKERGMCSGERLPFEVGWGVEDESEGEGEGARGSLG